MAVTPQSRLPVFQSTPKDPLLVGGGIACGRRDGRSTSSATRRNSRRNPIEQEGTYPLPEAQLDRFLLKVRVDYPTRQEERRVLDLGLEGGAPPPVRPIAGRDELLAAREALAGVVLDEALKNYCVQIVQATRRPAAYRLPELRTLIAYGASPRATIALARTARARALLEGRAYTMPDDVKALAHDVLRHRIVTTYEADAEEITTDDLIDRVLEAIEVP